MGALTIKPLAYKVRSWELNNIDITNFLDTYCGQISIHKRGNEIMRVLPSRKDFFYWISDKSRFFFESLKKQRLTFPFLLIEKKYIKLNWKNIIIFFKYFKYMLLFLDSINNIEKKVKLNNLQIYKNICVDNLTSNVDLLSNFFIKLIFQTKNLIKYENKIYKGNRSHFYYPLNILDLIKNNKYNLLYNLSIINDYPRLWSYIKLTKIIYIGVKKNLNFFLLTLNNTTEEILKIQKAKNIIEIIFKNFIIFTEQNLSNINIKQLILSKNTENLNSNWLDNNINNSILDKNLITWNFFKDKKTLNKGLNIKFATHGCYDNKLNAILLPITTFMEEYSLRFDSFGIINKSMPVNIRSINLRNVMQVLQLIQIICINCNSKENFVENKLLKNLLFLKYGNVSEFHKNLFEFINIPINKNIKINFNSYNIENILYKYSDILNVKKSNLKKSNNY